MIEELWKDIKGFEDVYEVSSLGYVRNKRTNKDLNSWHNYKGYMKVTLSKNGEKHEKFIHRLVAEQFIENPNLLPQVNHIDGNKDNNAVYNLEWCTCKENIKHSYEHNLIDAEKRANNRKDNHNITFNGVTLSISKWAETLGVSRSRIYRMINKGIDEEKIISILS